MTIYHIDYHNKEYIEKNEFKLNNLIIKILFTPISNNNKFTKDYLNDIQADQLDNLLYKKPDSCFYDEIKSYDSLLINEFTVSSNHSIKTTGNLFIFDIEENIIGYLSYRYLDNYVFIENVCVNKKYRGMGIFKFVFKWFLEKAKSLYSNILGFKLTVWKESPFNKNNEIVEIYKKFGFVYTKNEKYSSKRTYIHMIKNLD